MTELVNRSSILRDRRFWLCGMLAMAVASLSVMPYIAMSGGALTVIDDFDTQQIPFLASAGEMIRSGSGQWCWDMDLGTSFIQAYAFYDLGSPFFWLSVPFPKSAVPYLMGPLYVLKYTVAAMAAFAYLGMFLRDRRWAVLGAMLYAFSGFQCYNLMFFHFHDVVALFPLLLIGLEILLADGRKAPFAAAVAVNCLCNYFFFIGEVVFLMLYYLFRRWGRLRRSVREAMSCFVCGIAGVMAAGVLFLPSVAYILSGTRIHEPAMLGTSIERLLTIMKGFVFPLDVMNGHFALMYGEWWSISCYLPLWGVSLVIAHVVHRRDWLGRFIILLTVVSFVPALNAFFYLFTNSAYMRWWYMLVLLMALATARMLEERDEAAGRAGVIAVSVMASVFAVLTVFLSSVAGVMDGVNRWPLFLFNVAAALAMAGVSAWMYRDKRVGPRAHIAAVSAVALFCTCGTLGLYRSGTDRSSVLDVYECALQAPDLDPQYRYDISSNIMELVGNMPGAGSFSSTVSNQIWTFNDDLAFYRLIRSVYTSERRGLKELIGARYYVSNDPDGGSIAEMHSGDWDLYVREQDACPIGFAASAYMTESELMQVPNEDRAIAMLACAIVPDEDERLVAGILPHETDVDTSDAGIAAYTDRNAALAVSGFERDNSGFRCETGYDRDTAVYFSVPADDGWTAYIDGIETEFMCAAGMICVVVPAGEHEIEFSYWTPGFSAGICASIAGWSVIAAVAAAEYIVKKKKGDRHE